MEENRNELNSNQNYDGGQQISGTPNYDSDRQENNHQQKYYNQSAYDQSPYSHQTYGEQNNTQQSNGQQTYGQQNNNQQTYGQQNNNQQNYYDQSAYGQQGYNGQQYYNRPNYAYNSYPYERGPVTDVFCYFLLVIFPLRYILAFFSVNTVFSSMDYYSIMNGMYTYTSASVGSTLISVISYMLTIGMIAFLVMDIVKIHKQNYNILGLILFAIFLKPGYYLWRAHILGRKKTVPIIYTVLLAFLIVVYVIYVMYKAFELVSMIMMMMY